MNEHFDYKKILKAYIEHVGTCEGISFLERVTSIPGLSTEEFNELIRLDKNG